MQGTYASKLRRLGFNFPAWSVPASESLVRKFEQRFGVTLPPDYREFLLHHGGVVGCAACPFQEPTPCGSTTCIETFYGFTAPPRTDNILEATEIIQGAPDVVAIGDNLMGYMFWLKCTGSDAGAVFMHDHEKRSAWPESMFYERFSRLSLEIEEYLLLRNQQALPEKPKGYEHIYCLAKSFSDFMDSLVACPED